MPVQSQSGAFPAPRPVATGNTLVLMRPKARTSTAVKKLKDKTKLNLAVSRDFKSGKSAISEALGAGDGLYLDNLNVAVVQRHNGMDMNALSAALADDDDFISMRPEFFMYAYPSLQQRYDQWVRDGLHLLADGMPGGARSLSGASVRAMDEVAPGETWGITAVKAGLSPFTGACIKIAVLDTGFDLEHPDFAGRNVTSRSFVPGEAVQDGHGHGTHCIGSAAGPMAGEDHPRYGVAPEADIFVGKVLSNAGSGTESGIIAGMDWAINEGCEIISMSLGRATQPGEAPDPIYEQVGKIALENGSLIIAAAGNESARQFGFIAPVGAPANSPSIMAVAAVDNDMQVANFSCGGINAHGGEINISGPGVDVFSSWPMPLRHKRISGTSMATPHVAGLAALYAQSDPELRGSALWDALRLSALDIGLPIRDGGAGLSLAPTPSQSAVG